MRNDYRAHLQEKNVREKDLDIDNFLNVLEPYYRGGEYDYLLNSDKELDLLHKRLSLIHICPFPTVNRSGRYGFRGR